MRLLLFTQQSPTGNAVELAKAIAVATGESASYSIDIATRLFSENFGPENPLELVVLNGAERQLREVCLKFTILVDNCDGR